jgi:histidinol dehydrogenase
LTQISLEVQKKTPDAIKILGQMLTEIKNCGVYVPKKECFYPSLEIIAKVRNIIIFYINFKNIF